MFADSELQEFSGSVIRAFDQADLAVSLRYLDKNLAVITVAPSFSEQVDVVLLTANRQGWIISLLDRLEADRESNKSFLEAVQKLRQAWARGRLSRQSFRVLLPVEITKRHPHYLQAQCQG